MTGNPRRARPGGQHDAIVTWAVEGATRWYADPTTSLTMTTTVEADTRAWRSEADRIMGFWGERLIADPNACILTTEMLEAFNHWLQINQHNPWPKGTFGPRFEQHAETTRHGVTVARTLQPKGLSRYGLSASPPPARPRVYQGVRLRDSSDFHDSDLG